MFNSYINKFIGLVLFLAFFNGETFSQSHPILENFYLIETNGSVILNWTIKGGSTCNGIQIYRSTDTINYSQVGEIAGVCGNSSSPQPYTYTDDSPEKNKINYYKLQLGQEGFTTIISVEIIDVGNSGNQVRPNPAKDNARIYFKNEKNENSTLFMYGSSGTVVLNENSDTDYFDLDFSGIISGTYVFTIYQGNKSVTTGRIIIVK